MKKSAINLNHIREYYNGRYVPEDMGPSARSFQTYNWLYDWVGVSDGTRVLDVACGVGPLLKSMGDRVERYGIDLSEKALTIARDTVVNADFTTGDMQKLPFKDKCFDIVFNHGGLEHSIDLHATIREMLRVCKSGGKLCIVVPNGEFFWYRVLGIKGTRQQEMLEIQLDLNQWLELIESNGAELIDITRDPGPNITWNRGVNIFFRSILRKLALTATRPLPITMTYQFVISSARR